MNDLGHWFPFLTSKTLKTFSEYGETLEKWNKKLNLVSPQSIQAMDSLHFADSIHAWQVISNQSQLEPLFWDVGTGNGFPGMIGAILFPEVQFVLIDSDSRKISFLQNLGLKLRLQNVAYKVSRVEEIKAQPPDAIICRGFAPLDRAFSWFEGVTAKETVHYFLKGPGWKEEMSQMSSSQCSMWNISVLGEYKLPHSGDTRFVLKAKWGE